MEMTPGLLPPAWQWWGWAIYLAGGLWVVLRMPWYWFARPGKAVLFAASTVAVFVGWQVRAVLPDGPAIHLLGATLLTLAFGPELAILSLSLVLAGTSIRAGAGFGASGVNGVLLVLLAVATSYVAARASERWLPRHLFVYVFAAAFFGAALTTALCASAACGVLALAGRVSAHAVLENYLPTSVLLLFPEAFVTGALVTLAVVYRPDWLVSYRDRDYIDGR